MTHKDTEEPPVSGHPRDQKKCPLNRGVRLWEVKNIVFVCSWEHGHVSAYERCPPCNTEEVFVSGSSTVYL